MSADMSADRAAAVEATDHLTALVWGTPEVRAACERLTVSVSEVVRMLIVRGVEPGTAASAIAGQVASATLLSIAQIGVDAMQREEQS